MTGHAAATTHAELIAGAAARLASASDSPRLDAEVLLRHAAGLDRTALFLALREAAPEAVRTSFETMVERRMAGEPVAYLTGRREFMGLPFVVTPDVLVPRPETELLVEWALGVLPELERPVRTADVGAGSGAIAISLASLARFPIAMTAVEPSVGARAVIARNAEELLPPERRDWLAIVDGDLLDGLPGPFGMVLANLPYLTPAQIAENPALATEPRMALDGGPDGLDLIERLVAQLPERMAERFAVGLEVDPSQAATVAELLARALPGAGVSVIRDYAGLDRHVVATRLRPPDGTEKPVGPALRGRARPSAQRGNPPASSPCHLSGRVKPWSRRISCARVKPSGWQEILGLRPLRGLRSG